MSRYYEMSVEIFEYDVEKIDAIKEAAAHEWSFDDWTFYGGPDDRVSGVMGCGRSSLCGGETEEEFADRLAVAIWRANGGCCEVDVDATFLENQPFESHVRDQADYERLLPLIEQQETTDAGDQSAGDATG